MLLFDPKPATFGDNATYLTLGKSLAGGTGYRDLSLPDAPVHTQYPPGFPLMLAGITLVFGGVNVLASKLFVVLTGIGAMYFIYRLCELTFPKRAWPVMALFASVPALVENNHWVLSEMPFLLVTAAALYCLVLADQRPGTAATSLRLGACGLAIAAYFIRTVGIAVVLGVLLFLLVRRRYPELLLLVGLFAATAVPWQHYNTRAGHSQPYIVQLLAKHPYFLDQGRAGIGDWALRIWENLRDYVGRVIPRMLCPVRDNSPFEVISGIILLPFVAIGFVRGLRRSSPMSSAGHIGALQSCALFAGPLLLCWPRIWLSERFLLPFLPLVVIFLFSGMEWVSARLRWRLLAPALVALMVLANTARMASLARRAVTDNIGYLRGDRYSGYSIDWRRCFESIEWIRAHTPDTAIVMARKPEFVYLLSGRRSFCYPFSNDTAEVKSALLRSQYVLLDQFMWTGTTAQFLAPVLKANLDVWEINFATPPPEFYVLSINPAGQTGTAGQRPSMPSRPASADH